MEIMGKLEVIEIKNRGNNENIGSNTNRKICL